MTSVITAVAAEPIEILEINPAAKVDDDFSAEGDITQTREFNVITNASKTELDVFRLLEIEPAFLPGTVVNGRKINNLRIRNTDSDELYILEVEFIPYEFKTPFSVPIEWEWESASIEVPAYADENGKPLVLTSGEPIEGLTRRINLWVLKGTRSIPGVPKWLRGYGVSVNSDRVKIDGQTFEPNNLQLQRLSIGKWQETTIGKTDVRFRSMNFELWWNPNTWSTLVPNKGFSELMFYEYYDISAGKKRVAAYQVRATNAEGEETKHRVFLNRDGQRPRDADGNVRENLDPRDIITLKFDLDKKLPYSPILK